MLILKKLSLLFIHIHPFSHFFFPTPDFVNMISPPKAISSSRSVVSHFEIPLSERETLTIIHRFLEIVINALYGVPSVPKRKLLFCEAARSALTCLYLISTSVAVLNRTSAVAVVSLILAQCLGLRQR